MYIDLFDNIREYMRKIPNCKLLVLGDKNYTIMFEFLARRDALAVDCVINAVDGQVITAQECPDTPIYTLDAVPFDKAECLVAVAFNMPQHETVKNQLASIGYNNVYCFANDDFLGLAKIAQTEAFWLDRLKTEIRDDSLRRKLLIYIADGTGLALLHVLLMRGVPVDGVVLAGDGGELPSEYGEIAVYQAEKIPFEKEDCLTLMPMLGEALEKGKEKFRYCGFDRFFEFSTVELIMLPYHEQFYGMFHKLYGVENKVEPTTAFKNRAKKVLSLYDVVNICFMDTQRLYTLYAAFFGVKNKKNSRELYAMMPRANSSKVMGKPQYTYGVSESGNSYFFHKLKSEFCFVMPEDVPFWRYFIQTYPDRVKFSDCFDHYEYRMFVSENYRSGIMDSDNIIVKFTANEENIGREKLKAMGVIGDYVAFYSRDSGYVKKSFETMNETSVRNSNIENYRPMTEWLWEQGIQSVRCGKFMEQKIEGDGIIDYASHYQEDFMDFYMLAKSKCLVGDNGSLHYLAAMFDVPTVMVNNTILSYTGDVHGQFPKKTISLIKKIYSIKQNRYLSLAELIDLEEKDSNIVFGEKRTYSGDDYRVEDNTAEEILDAVKEMFAWIDGTLSYTDEELALQEKFQKMVRESIARKYRYWMVTRLSTKFLLNNPYLLE